MNQDLQSADATYCTLLKLFENYEINQIVRFIQANFQLSQWIVESFCHFMNTSVTLPLNTQVPLIF